MSPFTCIYNVSCNFCLVYHISNESECNSVWVWPLQVGILASCGSLDLHYTIFRKDEESMHTRDSSVAKNHLWVWAHVVWIWSAILYLGSQRAVRTNWQDVLQVCLRGPVKNKTHQLLSTRLVVYLQWTPKLMIIFCSEIEWRIRESIYHIYKRNLCVKQADSCENNQEDVFVLHKLIN